MPKMKMKVKRFGKINSIFEFSISKLGCKAGFMKICTKKIYPFCRTFLTNRNKNDNEDEKIWGNKSTFLILYIKIRLCGNFYQNPRKNFLTHLLRPFWLIEAKMKIKKKKIRKIKSIFEFSISKLGYVAIFMKIVGKNFRPIFLGNFYLRRTY